MLSVVAYSKLVGNVYWLTAVVSGALGPVTATWTPTDRNRPVKTGLTVTRSFSTWASPWTETVLVSDGVQSASASLLLDLVHDNPMPVPVAAVAFVPDTLVPLLLTAGPVTVSVLIVDAAGNVLTRPFTATSSDPAILTATAMTGPVVVMQPLAPGRAVVTVTCEGLTDTLTVDVLPNTPIIPIDGATEQALLGVPVGGDAELRGPNWAFDITRAS